MKKKRILSAIFAMLMTASVAISPILGCTPASPPTTEPPTPPTPVDMQGVSLSGAKVYYDGNKHSLSVEGAPVGASITYTYNGENVDGVTEVGTYVVVAKITADGYYEKTLTATLVITEVQLLEMTGITFDGKSVVAVAYSQKELGHPINGPWIVEDKPFVEGNVGGASTFVDYDGTDILVMHKEIAVNGIKRYVPQFLKLDTQFEKLVEKGNYIF